MRKELGSAQECDLDLILTLDARTGGPLTPFLARRAGTELGKNVRATRSTLHCSGSRETDVEISWDGGVLLVVDKIHARFARGQPQAYRTEVEERRAAGETAAAVLVSPARRRPHYAREACGWFDAMVTCEELAGVAEADGDRFSQAAAMLLRAATEPRLVRPGMPAAAIRVEWGEGYRRVVSDLLAPGDGLPLGPRSLTAADAEWMWFSTVGIGRRGLWAFGHQLPGGHVVMELKVDDEPRHVPPGATASRSCARWWVSLAVPPVTFDRAAEEQRDAIAVAVDAAQVLRRWAAASA
jgi:hypothetical protein